MKPLIFVFIFLISNSLAFAQKSYMSTAFEGNFSYVRLKGTTELSNQYDLNSKIRTSLWLNFHMNFNHDFNRHFGGSAGISVKNIGIQSLRSSSDASITEHVLYKQRTYALGVPISIKIGNLDSGNYVFFGGSINYNIHYKEKEFLPSGKIKYTEWFSDQVNKTLPMVFIGITFKGGYSFKISYALDNFLNPNYQKLNSDNNIILPKDLSSKILLFSFYKVMNFNAFPKKKIQIIQLANR